MRWRRPRTSFAPRSPRLSGASRASSSAAHLTPKDAEAHRTLRKRAETYLFYLVVQREAIGLRNHDDVYERYAVPGPLPQ